ncbi:hypothetical protein ATCC90586_007719 [Pythium insidiosum]|nr:hypothetical protein ATCC90586_007719 [Pythium insidiosum]
MPISSASACSPLADGERLSALFLDVAEQLEALEPVRPAPSLSSLASSLSVRPLQPEPAAVPAPPLLLPRERIADILRETRRFRPCEEWQSVARGGAAGATSPAPSRPAPSRRESAADVPSASTATAPQQTPAPAVFAPVGGRARVLPAGDLARAKAALKKRSHALTNLQASAAAAAAAAAASSLAGLHDAPGSTWDLFRASSESNAAVGKQALIGELVRRTHFSTQHIFHMSRKFKEMAGHAKSIITFAEFRQIMSDDVGALLDGIGVGAADFEELATTDMRAIGATISASESFLRRLFQMFDADGDGRIDFREFVVGLNGFVRGSLEDKVDALFEVYQTSPPPPPASSQRPRRGSEALENGDDDVAADLSAEEAPRHDSGPRVAISELLGLFQGDRQLYQELMRCVDEYFVRVELRDESTMTEDEFVAASLAEPRLLDTVSRPSPSRRYGDDAALRDMLRSCVDRLQLSWRKMLALLRAIVAAGKAETQSPPLQLPPPGETAAPVVASPSADGAAMRMPIASFHQLFLSCVAGALVGADDDGLVQQLLRSYVHAPRLKTQDPVLAAAATTASVGDAVLGGARVDCHELLQDLAAVLHVSLTAEADAECKARYHFELFDVDHDGVLSRSELLSAVCSGFAHFGPHVTEVVRILEDEDLDHDGELTKDDYIRAARRSPLILASLYTSVLRDAV